MPFTYVSIQDDKQIVLKQSGRSVVIEAENISIFLHESQVEKIVRWAEERKSGQYDFLSADNINVISGLKKGA